MNFDETTIDIACAGEQLVGILAQPESAIDVGVVIVVGGPQYRIGSHRQFVLLARALAAAGYPCLRFDHRGIGDSTGDTRSFEALEEDIAAAIGALQEKARGLKRIVLWGLCDAASAILTYYNATRDRRIGGLVLLNPWVRSEGSLARTQIKHYYSQRLLSRDFWAKFFKGQLGIRGALRELFENLKRAARHLDGGALDATPSFLYIMPKALREFPGRVLIVLSEDDYTAKEFMDCVTTDRRWGGVLDNPTLLCEHITGADHTFSSAASRSAVEQKTIAWLGGDWFGDDGLLPRNHQLNKYQLLSLQSPAEFLLTAKVLLAERSSLPANDDPHLNIEWFALLADTAMPEGAAVAIQPISLAGARRQSFLPLMVLPDQAGKLLGLSNFYTPLFGLIDEAHADSGLITQLARSMRRDMPRYSEARFAPLDPASPSFSLLRSGFRDAGWLVDDYFCFGNWYELVEPGNATEYLGRRPSRLRNTLSRAEKKLSSLPGFRLSIVQDAGGSLERAINDFTRVYNQSWKQPEPYPRFIPGLCQLAAREGWLRLGLIYLDDAPIAAQLWLVVEKKAYIVKLAYDQKYVKTSAGTVLSGALFRHVIDVDRVKEIDYLIGDDDYKRDWMSRRRERRGIIAFNPRTLSGITQGVRHVVGKSWRKVKTL